MYIKNEIEKIGALKNMFIVIEGMDGSGKSTIAEMLALDLEGVYYKTPSGYYQKIRSEVDNNQDFIEHFLFYLASVRYASEHIKKLLKKKTVICDRYIYSTLAYHRALGLEMEINIEQLELIIPNETFYLQVSSENQLERLKSRGKITFADDWTIKRRIYARLEQEFKKYPMQIVDTNNKQPRQIADEIENIIKGGFRK